MKKYNISKQKIENFQAISDVLQANLKVAEKITVFNESIEALNKQTKKMAKLQPLTEKNGSVVEVERIRLKGELIEKAKVVVTILKIYAFDQKKTKLKEQLLKITPELLSQCSDIELLNIVQSIWQTANKYGNYSYAFFDKLKVKKITANAKSIDKLQKQYGLTLSRVNDFEDTFLKFLNSFSIFEQEIAKKMATMKKIEKQSGRSEKLLENKLDLFVSLLENESPEFCKSYFDARFQGRNIQSNNEVKSIESSESSKSESFGDTEMETVPKASKKENNLESIE